MSATEAIIDGRSTILAGTNNYLGLTFDSECIDAARQALTDQGTGTTGSRMANGTYSGHVSLERELAAFYGARSAIVFSTGYVANLGMLSSLTGPGSIILIDADCHASIYDGCRLSGADILNSNTTTRMIWRNASEDWGTGPPGADLHRGSFQRAGRPGTVRGALEP